MSEIYRTIHRLLMTLAPDEQHECLICYEPLTPPQAVQACSDRRHGFHSQCLELWFARNNALSCPYCRQDASVNWTRYDVRTLTGGIVRVALQPASATALDLKNGISLNYGVPPRCVRIVARRPAEDAPQDIMDEELVRTLSNLMFVLRVRDAELMLLLDVPRCAGAPDELKCLISKALLLNPVSVGDGFVYERRAIENFIARRGLISPMNNNDIHSPEPVDRDPRVLEYTPDPQPPQVNTSTPVVIHLVCSGMIGRVSVSVVPGQQTLAELPVPGGRRPRRVFRSDGMYFDLSRTGAVTLSRAGISCEGDTLYVQF